MMWMSLDYSGSGIRYHEAGSVFSRIASRGQGREVVFDFVSKNWQDILWRLKNILKHKMMQNLI